MGKQNNSVGLTDNEKAILRLEKNYFTIISKIILDDDFIKDLMLIEKEISDNYTKFFNLWDLKNKIKVPAERVVRHHLYTKMSSKILGIFPSPLSSDFGIKTNDAVVCVDIKTIDTKGNSGDLKSTCVEKNQNSFNNKNYSGVKVPANMNPIDDYSGLPVLTFIVKIVYNDNDIRFKLSRTDYPSIVIACIPNGKLSRLFDYHIVDNIKTYKYFPEKKEKKYTPITLTDVEAKDRSIVDSKCFAHGLMKYIIPDSKKIAYFDTKNSIIWWETTFNKKHVVAPVESAGSTRYNNAILKDRLDEDNNPWTGYIEYTIP